METITVASTRTLSLDDCGLTDQGLLNATPIPYVPTAMVVHGRLVQNRVDLQGSDVSGWKVSLSSVNNFLRLIGLLALVDCILSFRLAILLAGVGAHIGTIGGSLTLFFLGIVVSFNTEAYILQRAGVMLLFSALTIACSVVTFIQYGEVEACAQISSSSNSPYDSSTPIIFSGDKGYFSEAEMCLQQSHTTISKSDCFCATTSSIIDSCFTVAHSDSCSAIVHDTPSTAVATLSLSIVCFVSIIFAVVYLWFFMRASSKSIVPTASAVYLTERDLSTVAVSIDGEDPSVSSSSDPICAIRDTEAHKTTITEAESGLDNMV